MPFLFGFGALGFDIFVMLTCSLASEINWREEWLVKLSGAKILEFFLEKGKKKKPTKLCNLSHPLSNVCCIQGFSPRLF